MYVMEDTFIVALILQKVRGVWLGTRGMAGYEGYGWVRGVWLGTRGMAGYGGYGWVWGLAWSNTIRRAGE